MSNVRNRRMSSIDWMKTKLNKMQKHLNIAMHISTLGTFMRLCYAKKKNYCQKECETVVCSILLHTVSVFTS